MISVTRHHDFSAGHRVAGHENKCAMLHGHNYRIHFKVAAVSSVTLVGTKGPDTALDALGRIIDFSEIKGTLCQWLEDNWDHKMLLWEDDSVAAALCGTWSAHVNNSLVLLPFNPTAENMALHLLHTIGPKLLPPHLRLVNVIIDETRKCSAEVSL